MMVGTMELDRPLVLGTRGSPLALAQAHELAGRLSAALSRPVGHFPLDIIRTTGDAIQDRALSEAGGKGLFTKEIDAAQLAGKVDIAVHSSKDLPTELPPGLVLAGYLPREDARDALIARGPMAGLQGLPNGARIGTVCGRYFAMDRDNRWDRVARAYAAIVGGTGAGAATAVKAVQAACARGETDEFIVPTVIAGYSGARDGDGVFCLNFRSDRAREILSAIGAPEFAGFDTGPRPKWAALLGMVDYSAAHSAFMTTAYPKQEIRNTLGEWVAAQGKTQLRLAETEKYPHVTFFLNGGRETLSEGEERYMAASPKVATYDLQPEMSAPEVADHLVAGIRQGFDLIVVNFANPDMVGHTGDLAAAIAACEAVDKGLGLALAALKAAGGAMIVTADHGNCETMVDPVTGAPHTAHTTNPVPVILVGGPDGARLRPGGRLADLAPTLLELMGLPQPPEMTGRSLIDR